ncbi:glycosyl transferase [Gottfriedia acidiceleris]|uniref:glycosyl transferase n=1 Tax=Gottfriedia acidiceleris TaxID=371036 RepID=UPI002F25F765
MEKMLRANNNENFIKNEIKFLIIGILVILVSTPLAYKSVHVIYSNKNSTGEYVPILNGFIHSYMLISIFIIWCWVTKYIQK